MRLTIDTSCRPKLKNFWHKYVRTLFTQREDPGNEFGSIDDAMELSSHIRMHLGTLYFDQLQLLENTEKSFEVFLYSEESRNSCLPSNIRFLSSGSSGCKLLEKPLSPVEWHVHLLSLLPRYRSAASDGAMISSISRLSCPFMKFSISFSVRLL